MGQVYSELQLPCGMAQFYLGFMANFLPKCKQFRFLHHEYRTAQSFTPTKDSSGKKTDSEKAWDTFNGEAKQKKIR